MTLNAPDNTVTGCRYMYFIEVGCSIECHVGALSDDNTYMIYIVGLTQNQGKRLLRRLDSRVIEREKLCKRRHWASHNSCQSIRDVVSLRTVS